MTSNRILQINATATAATGLAMLAARGFLPPLFGLGSPILLDLIAIFFLAYAAGLLYFAARHGSNALRCWRSPQPTERGSSAAP